MDSRLSGFYRLSVSERQKALKSQTGHSFPSLFEFGSLGEKAADSMIENAVGSVSVPVGIATHFVVNGKSLLVPLAVEETSVVAACSRGAKLSNGFTTESDPSVMIGQVLLVNIVDSRQALLNLNAARSELIELARTNSIIEKLGGGTKDIQFHPLHAREGVWIEVHVLVDCIDAMGANTVNTVCERIAPRLEELSGGVARMRIISNLCIHRKVRARTTWSKESLGGAGVVDAFLQGIEFAQLSPFRATTHNKGIMNGMDALALATGNDWRAVEASAHAFAAFGHSYAPLTRFHKTPEGNLAGEIELALAVGTVGGATKINGAAQDSLKLLGISSARELAEVMACVGLAQNFSAVHALVSEGIQKGHMRLHAKNIAFNAGASAEEMDEVARLMISKDSINESFARQTIAELRALDKGIKNKPVGK